MSPFILVLLFLYLSLILIHLYSCLFAMENPRMFTKIFLMPFLSFLYYKTTPKKKFSKIIFIALLLGFLGDVVLLFDSFFPLIVLGIGFFFMGHVLYIISFLKETGIYCYRKYFPFFVIVSVFYLIYAHFAFNNLKEGFAKGDIMIPGTFYLLLLAVLNISSGLYAFYFLNFYSILVHLGTFIFTVSDFILVRKMFYEENKYYQVTLMATYILAQNLICFGMANKNNKNNELEKEKIY